MELNEIHNEGEEASTSFKVVLLIFALVLIGVLGYFVYAAQKDTGSGSETTVKKSTSTTTATTPATNANLVACGDTAKYGFNLTFGTLWTGVKVKQVLQAEMNPQPGYAIVTCYFNMPTTDTGVAWVNASVSNFAHYAGLFAISVYTPIQWAAAIAEPAEIPTKLGSNANYVWGWSQGQATPTDLTAAYADVKNVIATFAIAQ